MFQPRRGPSPTSAGLRVVPVTAPNAHFRNALHRDSRKVAPGGMRRTDRCSAGLKKAFMFAQKLLGRPFEE